MRCPTCGTDNEADSRFCGGCGARIGSQPQPRLAPTHKITDDAPYPQHAGQPAAMPSGPVSYAPPSIPPPSAPMSAPQSLQQGSLATPVPGSLVRPASQPPVQRQPPRPQVSSASVSFTVPPRRPVGLMVALLILDIGLAAAGAVLLSKGLDKEMDDDRGGANAEPAPKKSEAPPERDTPSTQAAAPAAVAPAVPPIAPATPPMAAAAPPTAASAPAVTPAARKDSTKQRDDKKLAAPSPKSPAPAPSAPAKVAPSGPVTTPAATDKASGPQDPYAAVDTAAEIDAAAAHSKAVFDRCATTHGPVQGSIEIAFQVKPDGRIANAAAVENSTGKAELARCLVTEISSWRVSAHGGTALNMSRPFTYR